MDRLYESIDLWERLKGSRDDAAILSEIGNSGEPAAIIDIIPFILATSPDVATVAAKSVHKLVLGTTTDELVWLDHVLRHKFSYSGHYLYEWLKLSPDDLAKLERFEETSISLLGMASFHQNGYVREEAIKRLALITSGTELPFLILRANDWVANVRDAAYDAIRSRLKPDYARHFIQNLTLVSRLEKAGRYDHKPLVEEIYQLLQSDECRTALRESLESKDRYIRRAGFKLALNSTESDLAEVVRMALDQKDTVVRVWAAQRVSSAFTGATLDHFFELIKHDRFMPVRREALRIMIRQNSSALLVELHTALLDSHASIREEARYHLRKLDTTDVAEFYRDQFLAGEGPTLYSIISGLGETGGKADDDFIVPYASHQASKIRRAAVQALARLNRNAHVDLFIEALKDPVRHVSCQALKPLVEKAPSLDGGRIWELFRSAVHAHVKWNALSLIERLDKWDSIYYLLSAVRDSDEAIAARCKVSIECWPMRFNRSFSSPTSEQVARLRIALEESGNLLDSRTMEELRFSIAGFTPSS